MVFSSKIICLFVSGLLGAFFNQFFVVCKTPVMGKLTYKSFMSRVISLICLLIFKFTIYSAISNEFFTVYVFSRGKWKCNILISSLAILCDGVCVLIITGLMGAFSLCVLIYALSCGALGFMLMMYLCVIFSTSVLHCIMCWICFWYLSVGSLFVLYCFLVERYTLFLLSLLFLLAP